VPRAVPTVMPTVQIHVTSRSNTFVEFEADQRAVILVRPLPFELRLTNGGLAERFDFCSAGGLALCH
jgi:hypothetical protein